MNGNLFFVRRVTSHDTLSADDGITHTKFHRNRSATESENTNQICKNRLENNRNQNLLSANYAFPRGFARVAIAPRLSLCASDQRRQTMGVNRQEGKSEFVRQSET